MHLNEYPKTIASAQYELMRSESRLRRSLDDLSTWTAAIEREIAFDPDLKNEAQRKARRAELAAEEPYKSAAATLQRLQDDRTERQIELDLLKNTFSILKLDQRERIARLESTIGA